MSVLQLTISYAYNCGRENIFTLKKRKFLVRCFSVLLVLLLGWYLYLIGSVVSGNAQKAELVESLEKEELMLQDAEVRLLSKESAVQSFIASNGFESDKTFDVIRRTRNVAEISHNSFY